MAVTRTDAYVNGTERQRKDRENPLIFYDCQVEHWQHLSTTNAIERTFGTLRRRARFYVVTVINSNCS
ncbi:transposase-like protein [Paraburkholderia sp. GAS41]|jgi:transposase-like protein